MQSHSVAHGLLVTTVRNFSKEVRGQLEFTAPTWNGKLSTKEQKLVHLCIGRFGALAVLPLNMGLKEEDELRSNLSRYWRSCIQRLEVCLANNCSDIGQLMLQIANEHSKLEVVEDPRELTETLQRVLDSLPSNAIETIPWDGKPDYFVTEPDFCCLVLGYKSDRSLSRYRKMEELPNFLRRSGQSKEYSLESLYSWYRRNGGSRVVSSIPAFLQAIPSSHVPSSHLNKKKKKIPR